MSPRETETRLNYAGREVPLLTETEEIILFRQLQRGRNVRKQLSGNPPLSPEKLHRMQIFIDMGNAAREHLIFANLPLVIFLAGKFVESPIPIEDQIQEGTLALIKAIDKHKLSRHAKLSTHAWREILSVLTYQHAHDRGVSRPIFSKSRKRGYIESTLYQRLGRQPTRAEIAKMWGVTLQDVEALDQYSQTPHSLQDRATDTCHEGNPRTYEDLIPSSANTENSALAGFLRASVARAFDNLPAQEALVLRRLLGFNGHEPATGGKVGKKMGLTRARINQIKIQALKRLNPDSL